MDSGDDSEIRTLLRRGGQAQFPDGTFRVTVLDGPRAGTTAVMDGGTPGRLLVGTSDACDLRLEDREVSRRHLALELVGNRLSVVDLGSRNGTVVDHVAVREAWLGGGETIRIGSTTLGVVYDPEGKNPEVPFATGFGRMRGESRAMRRIYPLCHKLALAAVPVLIEGETGTGKEVLAEALHEEGPRASGPYVVFDCTAVPPNLIESELFGHERGSFTGAAAQRRGVFEQAHKGTLLIDEIGDLELALQAKLLRALERGEVRRVGGDKSLRVDVRILCATRRDLDREVQEGRFRDDLFHRLAVGRVELPPLRERAGDVAVLARHFWATLGGEGAPSAALLARWEAASWPGNVRELRNAVARVIALGDDVHRDPPSAAGDAEPAPVGDGAGFLEGVLASNVPWPEARQRVLDELERRYIERALAEHGGNVSRAAAASGIARRHLQRIKARARGE